MLRFLALLALVGCGGTRNTAVDASTDLADLATTAAPSDLTSAASADMVAPTDLRLGGPKKRIFVTDLLYDPTFGTLAGGAFAEADGVCSAALGGTFKAWLSDSKTDAISRIADVGPWYLVDGTTKIFDRRDDMKGKPLAPISQTSSGAVAHTYAWTGTNTGGIASTATCLDWTSASSVSDRGTVGSTDSIDQWTQAAPDAFCNVGKYAFYCIEQ